MNLPENYVVICETQEETNEVIKFIDPEIHKTWQFWKYVIISKKEWNIFGMIQNVENWFNTKNILDYKTFTFKEWKESKIIPERWCILATKENIKEISIRKNF